MADHRARMEQADKMVSGPKIFHRSSRWEIKGLEGLYHWLQRDYRLAILMILWLSLSLHLIVLTELEANSPFFYTLPPGVDQHAYIAKAREFAAGRWPNQAVFKLSPFYFFYLGLIYKFLGYSMVVPRVFQIFEGVLTCALLYKIGQFTFNANIGVWAAFCLATYGPFIFYNTELTSVPHSTLWISLSLFMAILYSKRAKVIYPLIIGAALGMATLGQPNVIIVLGGMSLWFSLLDMPIKTKVTSILTIIAVAALIIAIPTWHNYQVSQQLKFVTTTGDYNLYIGNNPDATGVYTRISSEVAERLKAGETTYLAEVGHFIQKQPLTWLLLIGRKIVLYLVGSDMELGSNVNFHFWGIGYSNLLSVLPLRYELISLMSLIGVRFVWHKRTALLYFCYGVYALGTIFFFVQARFRMPFTPVLILLSTALVVELYKRYKQGDKAILLLVFGIILALVAILIRYYYLLSTGITIVS